MSPTDRPLSFATLAQRPADPRGNKLAILGGARRDAIVGAPGDRQSYTAMAFVLLFTATIAGLSMCYALGVIFSVDPWWMAPVGAVWAAGIFAIDRALTIQLTQTKGFWRTTGTVLPRLVLAVILGGVISLPLTLQIFQPEINAQIKVIQIEKSRELDLALAQNPQILAEKDVLAEKAAAETVLAKSDAVNPLDDPTYAAAKATADAAKVKADEALAAWVAESNGTGGTGRVGTGPIEDIAEAAKDQARAEADRAQATADTALVQALSTLGTKRTEDKTAAQTELDEANAKLAEIKTFRDAQREANDASVAGSAGISNRFAALNQLSESSAEAAISHWGVFAVFFAIELLPVILKLLRNRRTESVHDANARERDDTERAVTHEHYSTLRSKAQVDALTLLSTIKRERDVALHADELALASQKWVNVELDKRFVQRTQKVLDDWDADALRTAYGSGTGADPFGFDAYESDDASDDFRGTYGADASASDEETASSDAGAAGTDAGAPPATKWTPEPSPEDVGPHHVPVSRKEAVFEGVVLGGRFQLGAPLAARGGTGRVYPAIDLQNPPENDLPNTIVKVIDRGSNSGETASEASGKIWKAEVSALEELGRLDEADKAHVVEILAFGIADAIDTEYWIASTLYRPGSLNDELFTQFSKPISERPKLRHALLWMMWTAEGVAAAHRVGISHGDIKPANLVLDGDRNLRVIDFGLARTAERISPDAAGSGRDRGTPYFAAPEVVLREHVDADIRPRLGDMYSLGAVFYWMLSARRPRLSATPATNPMTIAWDIQAGKNPLVPLSDEVPEGLRTLIYSLLCVDPEARFGHDDEGSAARNLAAALRDLRELLTQEQLDLRIGTNLIGEVPAPASTRTREARAAATAPQMQTFDDLGSDDATPPIGPARTPLAVSDASDADTLPIVEAPIPGGERPPIIRRYQPFIDD